MRYHAVYTFRDYATTRLDFEGATTDGGIFAPIEGSPWVVMFLAAGSGGQYVKMEIVGDTLVETVSGRAVMSDEGHARMHEDDNFDWRDYEWFNLTINDNDVTAEEFKAIFGGRDRQIWLEAHFINDENIQNIIFGSLYPYETETNTTGAIFDEILFNGIPISRLFTEPFDDVLGQPLGNREYRFLFYQGLELSLGWDWEHDLDVVMQINGFAPDLHMYELSGFRLNKTRAEAIAAFGEPVAFRQDNWLEYHILNPVVDYVVIFEFSWEDFFEDGAQIQSLRIFRLADLH